MFWVETVISWRKQILCLLFLVKLWGQKLLSVKSQEVSCCGFHWNKPVSPRAKEKGSELCKVTKP